MAFDAHDGYVLLFGGFSAAGYLQDSWKFVGGQWTALTPSNSPPKRDLASMTFDALDGYIVLFGGFGPNNIVRGDTWRFMGGNWKNITPVGSPPLGTPPRSPTIRASPGRSW